MSAFEELYKKYYSQVYFYVLGLCRNEHIAEEESSLEQKMIDREAAEQIHMVLHKMREPYREVFWMRVFGELSFKEIGSIHGKTESWARMTYHRARLMIRENFSDNGEE